MVVVASECERVNGDILFFLVLLYELGERGN